jgi:DNA-binding transcriptional regulator YhcF (GntR family)
MLLQFQSDKPIYLQLAESIEDGILCSAYEEEGQIPSTTELAVTLKINPATAAKGVAMLTDEGTVYKKRGLGMFVSPGARARILEKRRAAFRRDYVAALLQEAAKLEITRGELIEMLERSRDDVDD